MHFFFKVIFETVFQSFYFISNKFIKSKEESAKERKKLFRDLGLGEVKEEIFIDKDFLELKL